MRRIKKSAVLWPSLVGTMLFIQISYAAFEFQGIGWAAAAGNISAVGLDHPDRLLINPALMGDSTEPRITMDYFRPYAGLDLQGSRITGTLTLGGHPVVAGLQYFGDQIYRELQVTGGRSFALGQDTFLGLALSWNQVGVAELTPTRSAAVSVALTVELNDHVQIGSTWQNMLQLPAVDWLPQTYCLGAAFQAGPLSILTQARKSGALPMDLQLGLIARVWHCLQLATGYADLSQSMALGWRYHQGDLAVYYVINSSAELPVSQGLGLEVQF